MKYTYDSISKLSTTVKTPEHIFSITSKSGAVTEYSALINQPNRLYSVNVPAGSVKRIGYPERIANADNVKLESIVRHNYYCVERDNMIAYTQELTNAMEDVNAGEYTDGEKAFCVNTLSILRDRAQHIIDAINVVYPSTVKAYNVTIDCIHATIRRNAKMFPAQFTDALKAVQTEIDKMNKSSAQDVSVKALKPIVSDVCRAFWSANTDCGIDDYTYNACGQLAKDVYRCMYEERALANSNRVVRVKKDISEAGFQIILAMLEDLQKKYRETPEAKEEAIANVRNLIMNDK